MPNAASESSTTDFDNLDPQLAEHLELIENQLLDNKAVDLQKIDVRGRSSVADIILIASGNSTRHVKSMAEYLVQKLKADQHPPIGVEGLQDGEWVLVDSGDIIVHLMLPRIRDFYNLESLWDAQRQREAISTD